MTPKKAAVLNIIISLAFATAIILVSYFSNDAADNKIIIYLLIVLWFIPFTWLSRNEKNNPCDEQSE